MRERAWIVATSLGVAASFAIFLQCSSSSNGSSDAGVAECPTNPPSVGATCALPNDETCDYPSGCTKDIYNCVQGAWTHGVLNGKAPTPQCPGEIPQAGAECSECGPLSCPYSCGAPSETVVTATCQASGWELDQQCDAGSTRRDADIDDADDGS